MKQIILAPTFRSMVTVMEFKVKQARQQINFVRELKLDIFIHMVHLRKWRLVQFIDDISMWQLVEMGKKAPSSPVFSQTLRAPYMLESW